MAYYLVAQIDIVDRETYAKYGEGFMDIFSKFEGTMLAVDEEPKLLEGQWPYTRTVLISFPSEDAAMAWYHDPAYQEIAKHRFASSSANTVMIKGLDES